MSEYKSIANQGWQCPVCQAVYSPTTPQCWNCTGSTKLSNVTESKSKSESPKIYPTMPRPMAMGDWDDSWK